MVDETIKTIKETENEADEIIRKADATCTEILEKAQRGKRDKRAGCSKCKETGRSRSFAGERRRRSLKKTGFREDGTGDRSIKSTGSGKRRGGGSQSSKALL